MDLRIKGRVALITGASGGIGLATAKLLGEEGVRLVLTDLDLHSLEKSCAGLPGEPLLLAADMTVQNEVDQLVKQAEARFGQVDIVVHTAGVTGAKGDPLTLADADYEEAWSTDFSQRYALPAPPCRKCAHESGGAWSASPLKTPCSPTGKRQSTTWPKPRWPRL